MKVALGMEETTEMLRPPLVVEFLRELYKVVNSLEQSTSLRAQKWSVVEVEIVFESPCEVNSLELAIYEPQLETIGLYLELVMKQHYNEFCVLGVKPL